jgi:hypothetical protein
VLALSAVVALAFAAQPLAHGWNRWRGDTALAAAVLIPSRALVAPLMLCVCSWFVAGAAVWLFIEALSAKAAPGFFFLLGAYTFAWMIGFVVPLAPSGLGAREATLIALLGPVLGAGAATALSIGIRLANSAGDFLAIGAVEVAWLVSRRRRPPGPMTPSVGAL